MMLLALLLLLLMLLARIFAIQVFHFEHYQNKVLEQLTTESPVRAARGEILDAAGRVLATNQTLYRVTLYPHVIAGSKNADKFREVLVRKLPSVLPVSEERVREHLSHTGAMERTVATKVDRETAKDVIGLIKLERLQDVLAVEAISARYYPGATLASHVLGFTDVDKLFNLVMLLVGFYVLYAVQNVFDSTFYGLGKTNYMLFESVVTNTIYYGIAFILYATNIWTPTLMGIAILFGIGNAFDSVVSFLAYTFMLKKEKINILKVE